MYLQAGSDLLFETKYPDPYNFWHVLEVFNADDPIYKGSWVDYGIATDITCFIQYSGYYYVRVRTYDQGTSGFASLYIDGDLYASDIPVAGTGFVCQHNSTEELNYFTCFLTGDSRIWIEDYGGASGVPGRIRAYNDDYNGSGDWNWGLASRVKESFFYSIGATLLSASSAYNPTGTCDLYMNCGNTTVSPVFQNLEEDDAIRSGDPMNPGYYNCYAWSGGVISDWVRPTMPSSPWYDPNPLTAYDNYYQNTPTVRPVNNLPAEYYGRTTTSNYSKIDLWEYSNGGVSHASVRKPANNNPHGYDWESKPGHSLRTFHPRHALGGEYGYGSVSYYYRPCTDCHSSLSKLPVGGGEDECSRVEGSVSLSALFEQQERLTYHSAKLSAPQRLKLDGLTGALAKSVKSEFNKKYEAWKETWGDPQIAIHSNPMKYAESVEYESFLKYCREYGKVTWPLLFERFEQGDFFVVNVLEDLTLPEYRPLLDSIREDHNSRKYIKQGVQLIPSIRTNMITYIGELLTIADNSWITTQEPPEEGELRKPETLPQSLALENNYPNPFNPVTQLSYGIPSESYVSIRIYDVGGKEIAILVNDELKKQGWYTTRWNGTNWKGDLVGAGVYICRLTSGKTTAVRKITLIR